MKSPLVNNRVPLGKDRCQKCRCHRNAHADKPTEDSYSRAWCPCRDCQAQGIGDLLVTVSDKILFWPEVQERLQLPFDNRVEMGTEEEGDAWDTH